MERRAIKRFVSYSLIGLGTFLLDLALLFVLTDILKLNYVLSAGGAFLLAVSLNYCLSRRLVFHGSRRSHRAGYLYFLLIAGIGLLLVMGGLYAFVEWFGVHYLLARIAIAGITGIWNYTMNLFFNFKVAGVYNET